MLARCWHAPVRLSAHVQGRRWRLPRTGVSRARGHGCEHPTRTQAPPGGPPPSLPGPDPAAGSSPAHGANDPGRVAQGRHRLVHQRVRLHEGEDLVGEGAGGVVAHPRGRTAPGPAATARRGSAPSLHGWHLSPAPSPSHSQPCPQRHPLLWPHPHHCPCQHQPSGPLLSSSLSPPPSPRPFPVPIPVPCGHSLTAASAPCPRAPASRWTRGISAPGSVPRRRRPLGSCRRRTQPSRGCWGDTGTG